MKHRPSRLRRLDDALADLPLDEPMLLTELDGFLTGIALCPAAIPQDEWMAGIGGVDDGGIPPFDDPLDVQWFADAVRARLDEIVRALARGKPQPILDIDERNGDVLWEPWVDSFAEAMTFRPDSWSAEGADADALAQIDALIAIARDESALDSMEINAVQDRVPSELNDLLLRLDAARARIGGLPALASAGGATVKVGRNDPCPCGSGRKSKRCCA